MSPDPRSRARRRRDTEHRLTHDLDVARTRDMSMMEAKSRSSRSVLPQQPDDRFAARTGFDPRAPATPDRWFRSSPRRIQAWRRDREGGPGQQMETR